MLKAENVRKTFGKVEVLKGIDLEIDEGEIVVVVGKSGGGKTTFLRCVNALEHCDDGTIEINGKVLCKDGKYAGKKELREIRKDIGLVFQNFNLFPHMSVLENLIEAPQKVLGMSKEDAIKKAEETLGFLGLLDKKDNYPCQLSGGQKQRISIARALIKDPEVLILDDALSAVDTITEKQILKNIRRLRKNKTSIIIAHRISAVQEADNIIVLHKGRISEIGTHEQLIEKGGIYYGIYKSQFQG